MPTPKDALRDRLSRSSEINITVTGRKSGRTISNPIWFVFDKDDDKLYLLPVKGSETQWYKNVLKNPSIRIDARGADSGLQAVAVTDAKQVSSVVEMFRAKYGKGRRQEVLFKARRRRACSDAINQRCCVAHQNRIPNFPVRLNPLESRARMRRRSNPRILYVWPCAGRQFPPLLLLPFQPEGIHDTSVDMRFTARGESVDFGPARVRTGHSCTNRRRQSQDIVRKALRLRPIGRRNSRTAFCRTTFARTCAA